MLEFLNNEKYFNPILVVVLSTFFVWIFAKIGKGIGFIGHKIGWIFETVSKQQKDIDSAFGKIRDLEKKKGK